MPGNVLFQYWSTVRAKQMRQGELKLNHHDCIMPENSKNLSGEIPSNQKKYYDQKEN
jgi:hypothetical protein